MKPHDYELTVSMGYLETDLNVVDPSGVAV